MVPVAEATESSGLSRPSRMLPNQDADSERDAMQSAAAAHEQYVQMVGLRHVRAPVGDVAGEISEIYCEHASTAAARQHLSPALRLMQARGYLGSPVAEAREDAAGVGAADLVVSGRPKADQSQHLTPEEQKQARAALMSSWSWHPLSLLHMLITTCLTSIAAVAAAPVLLPWALLQIIMPSLHPEGSRAPASVRACHITLRLEAGLCLHFYMTCLLQALPLAGFVTALYVSGSTWGRASVPVPQAFEACLAMNLATVGFAAVEGMWKLPAWRRCVCLLPWRLAELHAN